MIYIIASATLDDSENFKLKRLYATNNSISYIVDFENDMIINSTTAKADDFVSMTRSQRFFINNIVYTSVRQLQGEDILSSLRAMTKQMDDLKGVRNYEALMFETINKYGVPYGE